MPFIVQIWMYLTPVIWPVTIIPGAVPLAAGAEPHDRRGEGFRWALLGDASAVTGMQAPAALFALSVVIAVAVLISGLFFFRSTERTFADII